MFFGAYSSRYIGKFIDEWYFGNKNVEKDEPKNAINQKILDSILDDDDSKFLELVSPISGEEINPNQKFSMTNYKIPKILSNHPSYASLCAFFRAEKCFSALSMIYPDGISSEQFKQKDDKDRSPIHFACAGGSLNIVRMLYEAGFDLNIEDNYRLQPSHYSAMSGTADIMKYLWTKGANILTNYYGIISPFQIACLYGNLDIVKFICENVDENDQVLNKLYQFQLFEKITPLHLACEGGHSNVVDYILTKKEIAKRHLTYLDHELRTPLLVACQNGCFECVKSLVKFGVLSIDPERNYSALNSASAGGFTDIVTFLLQQKEIDINKTDSNNMTALEVAIINGQQNTIEVLIQNGAVENKSEMEIGDLFLAACGQYNTKIVKCLDERMNIPYNTMGDTFMRQACKIESEELVNFLIEKNCSLKNIKINDFNFTTKWTPFMAFLKSKGLDLSNVCSNVGVPIIIKTIKYGKLDSVKKLISEGIELNKEIIEKNDLVRYSCSQGKTELFHFLMQYNPNIYNPTLFLDELMTKYVNSKTKTNSKRNKEYCNVARILLNDYKASPNNKTIINGLVSYCCIDFIELYFEFGASFDSCMIDFNVFRCSPKYYTSVLKLFKDKKVDLNTLICNNGNLLIVESIKNNEMNMFNLLISFGASFDGQLIDQYNLLDIPINNLDTKLFSFLINFHPKVENSTSLLKKIYSYGSILSINHLLQGKAYQITEVLLRDYHANPNEESVIEFVKSNCLNNIILLLAKYGASFNS